MMFKKSDDKRYNNIPKNLIMIPALMMGLLCPLSGHAQTVTIEASGVRIRAEENAESEVLALCNYGDQVEVISTEGNWSYIQFEDVEGYIYNDFLAGVGEDREIEDVDTILVNADDVNLREMADAQSNILAVCNTGDEVDIIDSENEMWTKVEFAGKTGYIFSQYLGNRQEDGESNDEDSDGQVTCSKSADEIKNEAIEHGKGRLGDKYSQEQRESEGYADCSSFVFDAFQSASGVFIGNSTSEQHDNMQDYFYEISQVEDADYGDVLYHFEEGDSHCGIYIGDGQVLHCSQTKGGVVISDYSGSNYFEYACHVADYIVNNYGVDKSDTEEYDSEENYSEENDSEDYNSEDYDSEDYDSEDYDSEDYDSEDYDSEDYDSEDYDSEEYDSEDYDEYGADEE